MVGDEDVFGTRVGGPGEILNPVAHGQMGHKHRGGTHRGIVGDLLDQLAGILCIEVLLLVMSSLVDTYMV